MNYRRDPGRDFARTLQQAFKARGYSVFFDYDSLQDGKFNEEIYSAIENCDVFIATYSRGSLDRCKNSGDWVRVEIEHALKHGKKVIPLAPTEVYYGWSFPRDLPSSLATLPNIQTTEIHTGKYFDDSVDHCIHERFPKGMVHSSAQQSEADAQEAERLFQDGRKHEYGGYERCDMHKALDCYRAAAELGHPDAQFEVGSDYSSGFGGCVRDMGLAIEWWEKAAAGGSPNAMDALADLHERGEFLEQDEARASQLYKDAFAIWRQRADAGDSWAQYHLANCYEEGKGTNKNDQLATAWYRKAAENNNIVALLSLGWWDLGSLDADERQKWRKNSLVALTALAQKGNPWCQSELADIYAGAYGNEWEKLTVSIKWLELAARQGYGAALWHLGVHYLEGNAVPVDYKKAYEYLAQAVQKGNRDAFYSYGICLLLGFNTKAKENTNKSHRRDDPFEDDSFRTLLEVSHAFEKGAEVSMEAAELVEKIRERSKRSGPRVSLALTRAQCWLDLLQAHADNGHSTFVQDDIQNAISEIREVNKNKYKGEDAIEAAQLLCDYADRIVARDAVEASILCKDALAIANGLSQETSEATGLKGSILVVLAKSLRYEKQPASALQAIQKALVHFNSIPESDEQHDKKRAECWLVLGKIHAAQQRFDDAISSFKKSFLLSSKLSQKPLALGGGDGTPAAEAALEIARCFSSLNNNHPATMWVQTAFEHLLDPETTQNWLNENRVSFSWNLDGTRGGPDFARAQEIRLSCEDLLSKVRLFNAEAPGRVAQILHGKYDGCRILAKSGWNNNYVFCDLLVFDDLCTIPLLLLPENQHFQPLQLPKQGKRIWSLRDCIEGNTVFPDALVQLAEKSLDAISPKRKERKQHCRCLIVCGHSTTADIRRLWREWLEHWERETGVKFCTYEELPTELAHVFNCEPEKSEQTDKVRYEVWLEGLPDDTPSANALMIGHAIRESSVSKSWNILKSVWTMEHRIDFNNPKGNGILVQKLTRKEAFDIRTSLVKNGCLASAHPMNG